MRDCLTHLFLTTSALTNRFHINAQTQPDVLGFHYKEVLFRAV